MVNRVGNVETLAMVIVILDIVLHLIQIILDLLVIVDIVQSLLTLIMLQLIIFRLDVLIRLHKLVHLLLRIQLLEILQIILYKEIAKIADSLYSIKMMMMMMEYVFVMIVIKFQIDPQVQKGPFVYKSQVVIVMMVLQIKFTEVLQALS